MKDVVAGAGLKRLNSGDWLRTGAAAHRASVSSEHVRYLVKRGRLRALVTPLGLLIEAASVDEWMANREASR